MKMVFFGATTIREFLLMRAVQFSSEIFASQCIDFVEGAHMAKYASRAKTCKTDSANFEMRLSFGIS